MRGHGVLEGDKGGMEVYMGNVLQGGEGQAPTRQAVLGAGTRNTFFAFILRMFDMAMWRLFQLK